MIHLRCRPGQAGCEDNNTRQVQNQAVCDLVPQMPRYPFPFLLSLKPISFSSPFVSYSSLLSSFSLLSTNTHRLFLSWPQPIWSGSSLKISDGNLPLR